MKIVGLTGGIGSGKSTIAKWFLQKGIPVYDSDMEAKKLMNENSQVREKLIELFGEKAYEGKTLNRAYIAAQAFGDKEKLNQLNQIVHPAVFSHFQNWVGEQQSKFVVKEAAILFESGSYKDCDWIISVIADPEIRIQRVIERDNVSRSQVLERMQNQWTDEMKIPKSDFVIKNENGLDVLENEFKKVFRQLEEMT